ncbi:MAG TPA: hypothetical protein VGL17_00070 [Gemmatimonadaceae bacterium]
MRIQRSSGIIACAALLSMTACGSDSTGPNNLDASSALQSLRLGLGGISDIEGPSGATVVGSLGVIAPLLDQINVTIDGKSQTMFGLGLRDTYPAGACEEEIFSDPDFPPPPGECTPVSLGVVLVLWQSHSAAAPPDRMILMAGDEGTTSFDFASITSVPGVAFYLEGSNFYISTSGTLTSHVASSGTSCTVPLPVYAKSATCTLATFNEQGTITFEADPTSPSSVEHTLTIAPQTVDGVWLAVTELQPINVQSAAPLRGLLRR